jgi:hypothetical protein
VAVSNGSDSVGIGAADVAELDLDEIFELVAFDEVATDEEAGRAVLVTVSKVEAVIVAAVVEVEVDEDPALAATKAWRSDWWWSLVCGMASTNCVKRAEGRSVGRIIRPFILDVETRAVLFGKCLGMLLWLHVSYDINASRPQHRRQINCINRYVDEPTVTRGVSSQLMCRLSALTSHIHFFEHFYRSAVYDSPTLQLLMFHAAGAVVCVL